MEIELIGALQDQLIAMADDELILGHRDSEWCGHAPILEEDIAFANLALDEIGHSKTWYSLAAVLSGEQAASYPDRMVFTRPSSKFKCLQLVELPNGDWALSMLRQYLFDASEAVRLAGLAHSQYTPLAEAAIRIQKEEIYHYRHTQAWVQRLGQGTVESHNRMQKALDMLWPYTSQIWQPLPQEDALTEANVLPSSWKLQRDWLEMVFPVLRSSDLRTPEPDQATPAPARGEHTPHLSVLIGEMQSLVRLDPQAEW
jgi:ring-1,2-phenylacetyl-CoA epoxidase subunit PaaC